VTPGGDNESFVVLLRVVCREVRLPLTFELIKSDPENEGVFWWLLDRKLPKKLNRLDFVFGIVEEESCEEEGPFEEDLVREELLELGVWGRS